VAFTTLTRYLKLKVDSDLSADAVYNLQRIDALASTFVVDASETLNIQSKGSIEIEPNDTALGGSGEGGTINLGTDDHEVTAVNFYSGTVTFFKEVSGTPEAKVTISNGVVEADTFDGDLTGNADTATDLATGSVLAIGKGGTGQTTQQAALNALVGTQTTNRVLRSDGTNTTLSQVALGTDVSGILPVVNGGTGAATAAEAMENLLPSYSSNATKVLALNSAGTALEWKAAGSGVVETISVSGPLSIDNSVAALPSISISQADTNTDGYLSQTDWDTFNNKEDAITPSGNASQFWNGNKTFASLTESDIPTLSQAKVTDLTTDLAGKEPSITAGTTGQYWRGDKSWQTLDKSAVGLSNVDNTSDVNKPVSSATQTALNAKYDASNPSNFVDAAGAKSAAVVNSTAGSETDQAPSVSAMKSYVTANSGPKFSTTWTVADGNSKTITHSLDTREVSITIYDENYETVYVDSETRTTVNAVDLVRVGTATGTWTVIVKKL